MPSRQDRVFAFIDSQNLHLGIQSQGWTVDYRKLRLYLKNKHGVEKALMFIGHLPENIDLYDRLRESGYILVFKPAIQYFKDGEKYIKGNVDAELVLHAAAIQYSYYS